MGTKIASGSYDGITVKLWDVETQQNISTFEGPRAWGSFRSRFQPMAQKSPPDPMMAQPSCGTLQRNKISTPLSMMGLLHGSIRVAFSPDGTILALGRGNGVRSGTLELWDVATRRIVASLMQHLYSLTSLCRFHAMGNDPRLRGMGWNGQAMGHDDAKQFSLPLPHTSAIYSVSFSPDGGTLASGTVGGHGRTVGYVWVDGSSS